MPMRAIPGLRAFVAIAVLRAISAFFLPAFLAVAVLRRIGVVLLPATVAVAMLLPIHQANAMPIGPPDVPDMVKNAQLIVVGRVENLVTEFASQQKKGSAPPSYNGEPYDKQIFSVKVDRVVHGVLPKTPLKVILPISNNGPFGVPNNVYGIFFLKPLNASLYQLVSPAHPLLPAVPGNLSQPAGTNDTLAKVASELVAVLASPPAKVVPPDGVGKGKGGNETWWDNKPYSVSGLQGIYGEASDALDRIPSETWKSKFREIAENGAPQARVWANKTLVSDGDWSLVSSVQPLLVKPDASIGSSIRQLTGAMEGNASSKAHKLGDDWSKTVPNIVPLATAMLGSTDTEVRCNASSILRMIGKPSVQSPLAKIGLNDKYQRVRWYAMAGLAETTGLKQQYPKFSPGEGMAITKQERPYIDFWRNWAVKNGGKLRN